MSEPAFRPHRHTLIGALGGLLAARGRELPLDYLSGVTGHAFRLNIDLVLSPGGPVEINFHELFPLWENLGLWCRRLAARPTDPGYVQLRAEALARLAQAAPERPVIGYHLLGVPEYGLVVGAEAGRLACLTLANPEEPRWMATADWPPAVDGAFTRAEAIWLLDLAPGFDARRAEVASLRFAVDQFWAPPSRDSWIQVGKGAYEFWQATLASPLPLHGPEPGLGHSYNLLLLHRARRDAAAYLAALAGRYPEAPSLAGAASAYAQVEAILAAALALAPFPGHDLPERRGELAGLLGRALAAEQAGVDQIERALRALR